MKTPQIWESGGQARPSPRRAPTRSSRASSSAAFDERTPTPSRWVAPRRIAGLKGVTRRSAPSPSQSSPSEQATFTGGNTSGIAADARMWRWSSTTGSTRRRLLVQIGWPGRPCTKVKLRPEW